MSDMSWETEETIDNARAWLTTIVGRVCIDLLCSRQSRREDYVGAWVPEPIAEVDEQADPGQQVLMADTIGLALLIVLETLTPAERVAYVLHDMFALPFAEIAAIIDRSPDAARQLASRARRRVRGATPQPDADITKQREVVDAFLAASRAGDFDALVAVLDPQVVFRSRGGPELQQELNGAADVACSMATSGPRFAALCHPALVNGRPGTIIKTREGPLGAVGFTVRRGLITTIDVTLDPDKLDALDKTAAAQADTPDAQDGADGLTLLRYFREGQGSAADRIITEALSWPGVCRAKGQLGAVVLHVRGRELGHLHGDAVADIPVPFELQEQLVNDGALQDHLSGRGPSWVTVPLDTDQSAQQTLALLRVNYQRANARQTANER